MTENKVFWVIKNKAGILEVYDTDWIYNTRKEVRESGNLGNGAKPVKIKIIEVN